MKVFILAERRICIPEIKILASYIWDVGLSISYVNTKEYKSLSLDKWIINPSWKGNEYSSNCIIIEQKKYKKGSLQLSEDLKGIDDDIKLVIALEVHNFDIEMDKRAFLRLIHFFLSTEKKRKCLVYFADTRKVYTFCEFYNEYREIIDSPFILNSPKT